MIVGGSSICGEYVARSSLRNILFACVFACALLLVAGCSTANPSYYGIQLNQPTDGLSEEQAAALKLARLAQAGSKEAQLELGIRFEEGDGVPQNLETAKALYSQAASDTQLKQTVFAPDGGTVRAETTYLGIENGLPDAEERLARILPNSIWRRPSTGRAIPSSQSKIVELAARYQRCRGKRRLMQHSRMSNEFLDLFIGCLEASAHGRGAAINSKQHVGSKFVELLVHDKAENPSNLRRFLSVNRRQLHDYYRSNLDEAFYNDAIAYVLFKRPVYARSDFEGGLEMDHNPLFLICDRRILRDKKYLESRIGQGGPILARICSARNDQRLIREHLGFNLGEIKGRGGQ